MPQTGDKNKPVNGKIAIAPDLSNQTARPERFEQTQNGAIHFCIAPPDHLKITLYMYGSS